MTISDLAPVADIKCELHRALQAMAPLDECALLDVPGGENIGTYLLWLGAVWYGADVLRTRIKYIASARDFSAESMARQAEDVPILLRGGVTSDYHWKQWPNWKRQHLFHRQVVSQYPNHPIVLLPQSIYFVDPGELATTTRIFNSHPDLTIFARDAASYAYAVEHFARCRVLLSPDIAFHLAGFAGIPLKVKPRKTALYLRRCEWTDERNFAPETLGIPGLETQDWPTYYWQLPVRVRGVNRLYRDLWCRRLRDPAEWRSRWRWSRGYPHQAKSRSFPVDRIAWNMMHTGVYQLQQYRLIISNRLHGHILSTLLGIPNILLPGPHQKMENFFTTWTFRVPFCRLVTDVRQVKSVAQELLETYSCTRQ